MTIGGGADSFYEYLVKSYLLLSDTNPLRNKFFAAWQAAVDSIQTYLASPPVPSSTSTRFFVGSMRDSDINYRSQELVPEEA